MICVFIFISLIGYLTCYDGNLDVQQIRSIEKRLQTLEDTYQAAVGDVKDTYEKKISGLKETFERELYWLKDTYETKIAHLENEVDHFRRWFTDHSRQHENKGHVCPVGCTKGISELRERMDKIEPTCVSIETNRTRRMLVGNQGTVTTPPHQTVTPKVAFYASLAAAHTTTGLQEPIKFEKVVTNVGNPYGSKSGVFFAPVAGVYVFFWNILNDHNSDIHTTLTSTEGILGNTFTGKPVGLHNEGSGLVVAHLNQGARVWVEKEEGFGNFIQLFSSFSGFLLFSDN